MHCCAINVADYLMWAGLSESKPKLPFVPGFEISGEILEISESQKKPDDEESDNEDALKIGDRVLALNKETLNGFSTECIADIKVIFFLVSLLYSCQNVVYNLFHIFRMFFQYHRALAIKKLLHLRTVMALHYWVYPEEEKFKKMTLFW